MEPPSSQLLFGPRPIPPISTAESHSPQALNDARLLLVSQTRQRHWPSFLEIRDCSDLESRAISLIIELPGIFRTAEPQTIAHWWLGIGPMAIGHPVQGLGFITFVVTETIGQRRQQGAISAAAPTLDQALAQLNHRRQAQLDDQWQLVEAVMERPLTREIFSAALLDLPEREVSPY